jgi:hypothetical protein
MIVTGMFVAQVARVAEEKLDVLGGVIDTVGTTTVGTSTLEPIVLVALVQREPDDDIEQGPVTVEAFSPAGESLLTAELHYGFPAGSENGFVYFNLQMPVPVEGRYSFVASAAGPDHSAAIGLRIIRPPE